MNPLSMYPEEETLREGQIEIEYRKGYAFIRIFAQVDEEAGGCGLDRKVMLIRLEGTPYLFNGKPGIYKNVGSCSGAPREYALKTIVIQNPNGNIIVYDGDIDTDTYLTEGFNG